MSTALKRFALAFGLWLVLTLNEPGAWAVGAVASAAATALSLRLLPAAGRSLRPLALGALTLRFAWQSLRGGLDVAWRALHPRLPLRPAWLAHAVRLPPGVPRVSLANLLSLMPGTLAAGGRGDALLVHCLDAERPVAEEIAAEERTIAAVIGLAPEPADG